MKITADVNLVNRGVSDSRSGMRLRAGAESSTASDDIKIQNETIRKHQRDRAQIDALIIAQVSRELVQKAVTISSRLQAMASEAITSGRIDIVELRSQVSAIEGNISDYRGLIVSPVNVPVQEKGVAAGGAGMEEQFRSLADYGNRLIQGERVEPEVFRGIEENLSSFAAGSDARTADLPPLSAEGAVLLAGITGRGITGDPVSALAAQGNIIADSAANLT